MSKEISFLVEGRLISIERFEDETDAQFAERSSFILFFRNDPDNFELAKKYSFHHSAKMFNGTTYKPTIERIIAELRGKALVRREKSISSI